jgi:hypothetical protein
MNEMHRSMGAIKKGYRDQLIYYSTIGIGSTSDISGVIVTETLVSTIKKRYKQLGGAVITNKHIKEWFKERRKIWNGKLKFDLSII